MFDTIAYIKDKKRLAEENKKLLSRIAELKAAIEPFLRVKAITTIYEYVPVEALRDDEELIVMVNGAEIRAARAALKGEKWKRFLTNADEALKGDTSEQP
jgi:hypothetical protein